MPLSGPARRRLGLTGGRRGYAGPRRTTAGRAPHVAVKGSVAGQIASALTALTAACALLISGLSLKVTKDGQLTGRYATAVQLLGSQTLETRIGAVYALGRIAVDSKYDAPVVTNLLDDFIKAKSVKKVTGPSVPYSCWHGEATPLDVLAALRVLLYDLAGKRRDRPLDLSHVCLNEVQLPGADLTCTILDNAVISSSGFDDADFTDASLQNSYLDGTTFMRANFTRADAQGAEFGTAGPATSAGLNGAVLRDADFSRAQLVQVQMPGADLTNTILYKADMSGVDLTGAHLWTYLGNVRNRPPEIDLAGLPTRPPEPRPRHCLPPGKIRVGR